MLLAVLSDVEGDVRLVGISPVAAGEFGGQKVPVRGQPPVLFDGIATGPEPGPWRVSGPTAAPTAAGGRTLP